MAHFAKLDLTNTVLSVEVVDNYNIVDSTGNEKEEIGIAYLESVYGVQEGIVWKQTSYNKNFRKNYAGTGFTYDAGRDAFIPPKPFASWLLNETTCQWEAPTPRPTGDGKYYNWNESTTSWEELT